MGNINSKIKRHDEELKAEFNRWDYIKNNGSSDPFWADGVNMNLIRNHIIYERRRIKELCSKEGLPLPDIYHSQIPPETDPDYMAKADEITEQAKKTLELYKNDENFNKLKTVTNINNKNKALIVKNVLVYMRELEEAISKGDLVSMRRHYNPETHLKAAKEAVDSLSEDDFAVR